MNTYRIAIGEKTIVYSENEVVLQRLNENTYLVSDNGQTSEKFMTPIHAGMMLKRSEKLAKNVYVMRKGQ